MGWVLRGQRGVWLVLAPALMADVALVALHVAAVLHGSESPLYRLDADRGYAELAQYVKLAYVWVLLALVAVEGRVWQIAMWLPLVGYLLADDALGIHENGGAWLVGRLDLPSWPPLRAQDLGELLVSASAGVVVGLPLLVGVVRGSRTTRWVYRRLAALVGLLVFFGVVVDAVHAAIAPGITGFDGLVVVEDGGELVAVTLLVAFTLRLALAGGRRGLAGDDAPPLPGTAPGA